MSPADRARSRTAAERESIVRWDAEPETPVSLYTADPVTARRWQRYGLALAVRPGGWHAEVPKQAVTVRVRARRALPEAERTARRLRLTARIAGKLRNPAEPAGPADTKPGGRTPDTPRHPIAPEPGVFV